MKAYVYFDSGTTNTRGYLICNGTIKGSIKKNVGTINNVLENDPKVLEREVYKMYQELLKQNDILDDQISDIYMSGMATSCNGIFETDYMNVPVSVKKYAQDITYHDNETFQRKIGYLTGLAVRPVPEGVLSNIEQFNNVRGEEIELFGIIRSYQTIYKDKIVATIMPGSHTHILFSQNDQIIDILSCIGGEFFAAIAEHTIIKASVTSNPEVIKEDALKCGFEALRKYGVNRAIYMIRELELFSNVNTEEKDSFLEGVINGDIIKALLLHPLYSRLDSICVAGKAVYYDIFSKLLQLEKSTVKVEKIEPPKNQSFALAGFLTISEQL